MPINDDEFEDDPEPTAEDIEREIATLLRDVEIGALAVVQADGSPLVADLHFAGDGLSVYVHTYTYTRKYKALLRDPRVSYALALMPAGGYFERFQLRAIQVQGIATVVDDPAEIERAITKCGEQFSWLGDSAIFDNFRREGIELRQVFIRIDPVSAMWNDNRVHLLWRKMVEFSEDHRRITAVRDYDTTAR